MATTVAAPRQRSNRPILLLAVVFGLLTAGLAYVAVSQATESDSTASGSNSSSAPLASETVIVAVVDIAARSIITLDMLEVRSVPIDARQPGSFSDVEEVVGSVAVYPTPAGAQVLSANVSEFGADAALAYIIPSGHRAIAVNATAVKAVGGYILPGDFVDIVGVFAWTANDQIVVTSTLAQDAEVLAVERVTEQLELEPAADGAPPLADSERSDGIPLVGEENPDALYLVVAVTPQEAQRVFAADSDEGAEFRFLLRRTGEHETSFLPAFIPIFGHCGDTLDSSVYGEPPAELAALNEQDLCALQQNALAAAAEAEASGQ
ncbi:MAG TPA: Flp pilus assembly protein CpaB [Dehalococcoidia bacterium]|nr:Flp pilus assembly protein CpaB [Dehalococcoidia bacterium]